ncbi:MAG TPA: tetratricopeptide repeat protein [Bacteroidota bacterium]|nr:tetratricopeptide repeat protein [Bacteroidota bacterium]
MKSPSIRATTLMLSASLTLSAWMFFGCGTVEETTEEEWTDTPAISTTARLEYRIDSLMNENRKLQQQLETVSTENRNLIARVSELQSRLSEAMATPRTVSEAGPGGEGTSSITPSSAGYESALARFRRRDYRGAIDEFSALLNAGISRDLADNCHYWIGESYFGMKKFNDAIQHFEVVLGMTGSDKADDAQFMIGNAYMQLGRKNDARQAFQRLLSDYPDSPLRSRAQAKLNAL